MNRIEAINAMLEGRVVRNGSFILLRIFNQRLEFLDPEDRCWKALPLVSYVTEERFGYSLYQKPADNYARIDGKKYKLVEE